MNGESQSLWNIANTAQQRALLVFSTGDGKTEGLCRRHTQRGGHSKCHGLSLFLAFFYGTQRILCRSGGRKDLDGYLLGVRTAP